MRKRYGDYLRNSFSCFTLLGKSAMKVIIQRVTSASALAGDTCLGTISKGLLVLVGISRNDTEAHAEWVCNKIMKIRLWQDAKNRQWSTSVMDNDYDIMVVSQPAIPATFEDGSMYESGLTADDTLAKPIFNALVEKCVKTYSKDHVKTVDFGTLVNVDFINDGPVTMELDSDKDAKNLKMTKARKAPKPPKKKRQLKPAAEQPQHAALPVLPYAIAIEETGVGSWFYFNGLQ